MVLVFLTFPVNYVKGSFVKGDFVTFTVYVLGRLLEVIFCKGCKE